MSGQFENKGLPTCPHRQVTSQVGDERHASRQGTNNAWYVNTSNGNRNNNNTNNRCRVVGASELIENCEEWLAAEEGAYKNKHHNFDAARFHYHLPELYDLAREVGSGGYKPSPMSAFILTYPVYREAFAPDHRDCIVDHYVSPLFNAIADGVHAANGDISHGNRVGHSAQGMAERILQDIRDLSEGYTKPCVHLHRDISSFFLSINREQAYRIVESLSATYYDAPDRGEKLALLRAALTNDPTKDVVLRSPVAAWNHVPAHKVMRNARPGCGLPIGKYPSQVVAGIVLSLVDSILAGIPGIRAQHFVDDYDIIAPTSAEAHAAIDAIRPTLAGLVLRLHPRKISVQPVEKGMLSCGRVVKRDRIYISNRTVRACRARIKSLPVTEEGAVAAFRSVNSYFGIMCHCRAWNIQLRIADEVLRKFGNWLYFRVEPGHLICALKKKYTPRRKAEDEIVKLINEARHVSGKNYQRNCRPCAG